MLSLDILTQSAYICGMVIVWMLFFAVVLQDGEPVWTKAMSFKTQAECEEARIQATDILTKETQTPSPDNAGGFIIKECERIEVPYTGKAGSI